MIPRAPSVTTSKGSFSPRERMSWKNARTVSTSSREPAIGCKSTLRPSRAMPRRRAPARTAGPAATARNTVDEQIDEVVLGQVAAGEGLVLGPQPLAQLTDRGAAEQLPPI